MKRDVKLLVFHSLAFLRLCWKNPGNTLVTITGIALLYFSLASEVLPIRTKITLLLTILAICGVIALREVRRCFVPENQLNSPDADEESRTSFQVLETVTVAGFEYNDVIGPPMEGDVPGRDTPAFLRLDTLPDMDPSCEPELSATPFPKSSYHRKN